MKAMNLMLVKDFNMKTKCSSKVDETKKIMNYIQPNALRLFDIHLLPFNA